MTNFEINQTIHEVMGKCWHDADKRVGDSFIIPLQWFCTKCGDEVGHEGVYMSPLHPSYTTSWADYGPMLEWAMKQEWGRKLLEGYALNGCVEILLNPLRGSTAIAEFLKERR